MFASFQNVLFVFDNGTDNDLAVYEYQLYEEDDIVNPNITPYALKSGVTPLRAGEGNSSVFAVPVEGSYVDVQNDNVVVQKNFFGRVRAKDTSGNPGQWTAIKKTDPSTPLIDSQYIVSLTADKIKAGTIESAEIILGGANPARTIIKSTTFDGTPILDGNGNPTGSYSGATQGWLINGQGKSYFYDTTIVGSIDIGGFDSGSFHVNTSGDMWLGSGVYSSAPFRISNTGNVDVGGSDSSSFHIDNAGNIWSGAGAFNTSTNPFSVTSAGSIRATTGKIGPVNITNSTMNSQGSSPLLNSNNNYYRFDQFGDLAVFSNPGSDVGGPHVGLFHKINMVGEYISIDRTNSSFVSGNSRAFIGYQDATDYPTIVTQSTTTNYATLGSEGLALVKPTYQTFYEHDQAYVNGSITSTTYIAAGSTGITDSGSVSATNWFRSSGSSGWFNQTHGGGIWMDESTTVKVYGNKNFYTGGNITADGFITTDDLYINGNKSNGPAVRIDRFVFNTINAGWNNQYIQFVNADTGGGGPFEAGSVTVNGSTAVRYNTSSDKRIKTNVKSLQNSLDIIKNINPVEFNFKQQLDYKHHGFLAQDLYQVYPYPINPGDDNETVDRVWSMDYSMLTPLLTAAIKELTARVEELEFRLI